MPQIFIDGQPFQARRDQTVLQVADENGIFIPRLCWHPKLSIAGNCRICVVQVEGRSWVEISCNMPVSEGLRVLTDTELVRAHRKVTMQFLTLNHPVDCGVCDKAAVDDATCDGIDDDCSGAADEDYAVRRDQLRRRGLCRHGLDLVRCRLSG